MLKREKKIDPKKFSVFKRFIPKAKKMLARQISKHPGMYSYDEDDLTTDEWIKAIVNSIRVGNMTMSDDDMIKDPGKAFTYYREDVEERETLGALIERLSVKTGSIE